VRSAAECRALRTAHSISTYRWHYSLSSTVCARCLQKISGGGGGQHPLDHRRARTRQSRSLVQPRLWRHGQLYRTGGHRRHKGSHHRNPRQHGSCRYVSPARLHDDLLAFAPALYTRHLRDWFHGVGFVMPGPDPSGGMEVTRIAIFTNEPVTKGEELTWSYGDGFCQPVQTREDQSPCACREGCPNFVCV
jgi:hypothetical protein